MQFAGPPHGPEAVVVLVAAVVVVVATVVVVVAAVVEVVLVVVVEVVVVDVVLVEVVVVVVVQLGFDDSQFTRVNELTGEHDPVSTAPGAHPLEHETLFHGTQPPPWHRYSWKPVQVGQVVVVVAEVVEVVVQELGHG